MLRRNLALILIFALALGVRCAYLPATPEPHHNVVVLIGEFAHNIDHGHGAVIDDATFERTWNLEAQRRRLIDPAEIDYAATEAHPQWQQYSVEPIGPPLLLAGLWKLTGDERDIYGDALQILIDSLVALLVYRIALLLFARRRAALVAATLYAVFPPIAQQTSFLNNDIWAIDFSIAILAAHLQMMRSPVRWRWLLLYGALVGVAAYFRPNLLLFPAALALASVPWAGWRKPARSAAIVTAVAVLVTMPWIVRNYLVFHEFVAMRTGVGVTMMVGLGELHNDFVTGSEDLVRAELHRAPDLEDLVRAEVHRERPDLVYSTPAYDAFVLKWAEHLIEQHPLYYAKLVARRTIVSTVGEYEYAWMYRGGESPLRYRARTGGGILSYAVNRPFYFLQSSLQPAVFLFAMLVLALTWRGRKREHTLLIAFVLATLIPYWIIHVEARYVMPTSLAYLIWIGLGADLLGERVLARARRGSARTATA
jgi:4-amino-4-deoxy-L-arabinose transferase-like glycosyltransferase